MATTMVRKKAALYSMVRASAMNRPVSAGAKIS